MMLSSQEAPLQLSDLLDRDGVMQWNLDSMLKSGSQSQGRGSAVSGMAIPSGAASIGSGMFVPEGGVVIDGAVPSSPRELSQQEEDMGLLSMAMDIESLGSSAPLGGDPFLPISGSFFDPPSALPREDPAAARPQQPGPFPFPSSSERGAEFTHHLDFVHLEAQAFRAPQGPAPVTPTGAPLQQPQSHAAAMMMAAAAAAASAPQETPPSLPPAPQPMRDQMMERAARKPAARGRPRGKGNIMPRHGDVLRCGWAGCSADFPDVAALGRHIHNYHVQQQKEENRVYRKSGSVCHWRGCDRDKPFNSFYNLEHHVRFKHTGEKPHACQHCDARFSQRSDLNAHLVIHMGPEERAEFEREKARRRGARKAARAKAKASKAKKAGRGRGRPRKPKRAPAGDDEFVPDHRADKRLRASPAEDQREEPAAAAAAAQCPHHHEHEHEHEHQPLEGLQMGAADLGFAFSPSAHFLME